MLKRKTHFFYVLFFLFFQLFFSINLHAFEVLPIPSFGVHTGRQEYLSGDLGFNLLFSFDTSELVSATGPYVRASAATDFDTGFFRFSGGIGTEVMGFLGWKLGLGYGIIPKNDFIINTTFFEASARALLLDIKIIYEMPISEPEHREYYLNKYNTFKFNIGLFFF
ncbi:MAG: hypothetical protein PUC37_12250 [Spirochaetales bacterium]|nr:hypothetical protein [Spirochaetales bacterium]